MKKILVILLTLLGSSNVFAQEACSHRLVESTKNIHVVPVYAGKVMYFFDDIEKKAHAEVRFEFNREATSECFKSIQGSYPKYEIKVARLDFEVVKVQVFKGLEEREFTLYPEPGGFFHGSTDLNVSYKSKMQIIKAIKEKANLINITDRIGFTFHELVRSEVAQVECLGKNTISKTVEGLHRRLGEVITELGKLNSKGSVAKEEALDLFMTNCVEFNEVEISSFDGLGEKLLRRTTIIPGKIPVFALKEQRRIEKIELLSQQESSYLDY